MAMTDALYLKALQQFAKTITVGARTVDDVPEVYITGAAQGVVNGSYTIDDIPTVLQEMVQAKITELQAN